MRRRELIISGGTLAAAAVAGCTSQANPDSETTNGGSRTIAVSASGSATGEPDQASFRAGLEESGDGAEAVRNRLSERAEGVRDALIDAGIPAEHITTGHFDVRRVTRTPERPSEEPVEEELEEYYEGIHSLEVEVDDVDAVGERIDAAIDAGADHVGRVRFTLSDTRREELREEALAEALEHAESEAAMIAEEVDVDVRDIKHVDTAGGHSPTVRYELDAEDAASTETELHPDDVTVGAGVDIVVEIA